MKELPGKGRWFRVIVGGFENREKAQAAADQMTGKIRGLKCVIRPSDKKERGLSEVRCMTVDSSPRAHGRAQHLERVNHV